MAGDYWDVPDPQALEQAAKMVAGAASIAILTGAGISTEAGIPDFRGPQGVWTKNPGAERLSTLDHYLEDPEVRRRAWQARLVSPVWEARPTSGHAAVVDLERQGKVHTIVTQNTDGLHQAAGSSPGLIVEVHGTTHWVACWSCGDRTPTLTVLNRVRAGEDDPRCLKAGCGGILKTATVSFGQSLDPRDVERAFLAAADAELLVAVGTTLEVQPVAGMVPIAVRSGRPVVIVNGSPTALDPLADVVARGEIGQVLPMIVGAVTG